MPHKRIPEPWQAFLGAMNAKLRETVELHCFGGFALTMHYGLKRATADVDVLAIAPTSERALLLEIGAQGSALHRQHGVYLQYVTIATVPENYDERLIEMFPSTFKHLRLFALDPYDIALSKLESNRQRDRDDVKHLARTVPLDLALLKERYENELRPNLGNAAREDLTLALWIEAINEER